MCIYSKHVTIGGNNIKHKKYTLEVDVIGYKVVSDIRISEIPAISNCVFETVFFPLQF